MDKKEHYWVLKIVRDTSLNFQQCFDRIVQEGSKIMALDPTRLKNRLDKIQQEKSESVADLECRFRCISDLLVEVWPD